MGVDRSKFKPASKTAMKALDSEIGQRKGYSESFERVGYHSIDSGDNKFRIYPAHPDSKDQNFWMPKSVAWFQIMSNKYDADGKKIEGEQELRKKPIFTSDVHGPQDIAGQEICKVYAEYAKKRFETMFETEDEKKKAGDLMYGFPTGFMPKLSWVMYADKYDDKGQKITALLEVSNGVKKKINELVTKFDDGDDALVTDPFTHPDDGIAIIITKTGVKKDTEYKVDFDMERKGKRGYELVMTPLTDEDLENFEKFQSLEKMYKNSFRRIDFEYELEGLQRFDEENQFFFFEDEEFLQLVEDFQTYLYSVLPEDKDDSKEEEENEPEPEKPKVHTSMQTRSVKRVVKPEPEEEYGDEEEYEATDELPFVPDKQHKAEAAKKVTPEKEEKSDRASSIDAIRARLAKSRGGN